MKRRAALYLRISDDRLEGQGVKDQQGRCSALAEQEGCEVTHILVDNDVSASGYSKKKRPEYEKLLDLINRKAIDVVIADDQDRLIRRPAELELFMETVGIDKPKVQVLTVRVGEHDFTTSSGRLTARIKGAVSAHESELKSERAKSKVQAQAAEGLRHGGSRPYGIHRAPKSGPKPCPSCGEVMEREPYGALTRAVITQCPVETARLRTMADMKIKGVPLHKICAIANQEGWPTSSGKVGGWRPQTIIKAISNRGVRGERQNTNGVSKPGAWEPILTPEVQDKLLSNLRTGFVKRDAVPTLLGGLKVLRCGRCKDLLHVSSPDRKGGKRRYSCRKQHGRVPQACGSCSAIQQYVDDRVVELLLEDIGRYIQDPNTAERQLSEADQLSQQKQDIEAAILKLTNDYYSPGSRLPEYLFNTQYDKLNAQLQEVEEQIQGLDVQEETLSFLPTQGQDPRQWWDSLPSLEHQRNVIAHLLSAIYLEPAGSGAGPTFRPERVHLDPKFGTITRKARQIPEPPEWKTEGVPVLEED